MSQDKMVWIPRMVLAIVFISAAALPADTVDLMILSKPLHAGRISPTLYGGFVELLDDHVPGMWAEMLGDRNFEGVLPAANWDYYLGAPNLCDRDWDENETWTYSGESPWNGAQSAQLTATKDRPARLTQSRLAVTKRMTYLFSGYFRNGAADTPWGRKRVQNSHPEPYGIKYWQLGNEVGDAEVAGKSTDFCQAIKKADPGATILSSFPSPELLERVGGCIRYLGPHYYSSDLAWVESDIGGLRRLIRNSEYRDTVKLAVTEWNINAGNWGLGRGRLYTLDCALLEARFLNLLHRSCDIVAIACRSNLVNSFCAGTIQTNAAGLYKVPGFHVMKLFRDHTQPVPLTISQAPQGLDVTACASEDHRTLTLFAINSRSDPIEVRLDLSTFGAGMSITRGEVVADTQDRRQIDVTNGWDHPDRVRNLPLQFQGRTCTLPALSVAAVEIR